jgi:hypothetical protein
MQVRFNHQKYDISIYANYIVLEGMTNDITIPRDELDSQAHRATDVQDADEEGVYWCEDTFEFGEYIVNNVEQFCLDYLQSGKPYSIVTHNQN